MYKGGQAECGQDASTGSGNLCADEPQRITKKPRSKASALGPKDSYGTYLNLTSSIANDRSHFQQALDGHRLTLGHLALPSWPLRIP